MFAGVDLPPRQHAPLLTGNGKIRRSVSMLLANLANIVLRFAREPFRKKIFHVSTRLSPNLSTLSVLVVIGDSSY